ncbi:hypothetical protein PINS_up007148 [Pythium insidiosum]|nr:hypothetical protein PINS_up007148 [Pythium insidiosum]
MLKNECVARELQDALCTVEQLRTELRVRSELGLEAERRQSNVYEELATCREQMARHESTILGLEREKLELQAELTDMRGRLDERRVLDQQSAHTQARVAELEEILTIQTAQLEKQQQALVALDEANTQLRELLAMEQSRAHQQVKHHVESSVAMQQLLEECVTEMRQLKVVCSEARETSLMQQEELRALAGWRTSARRRESQREVAFSGLEDAYMQLQRTAKGAETSRRRTLAELVHTKKQLELVRDAMRRVDADLAQMSKTIALFRTRSVRCNRRERLSTDA